MTDNTIKMEECGACIKGAYMSDEGNMLTCRNCKGAGFVPSTPDNVRVSSESDEDFEKCEGCPKAATHWDADGIPCCDDCWKALGESTAAISHSEPDDLLELIGEVAGLINANRSMGIGAVSTDFSVRARFRDRLLTALLSDIEIPEISDSLRERIEKERKDTRTEMLAQKRLDALEALADAARHARMYGEFERLTAALDELDALPSEAKNV